MKITSMALICYLVGLSILTPREPLSPSSIIDLQTSPAGFSENGEPTEYVLGEILVKFTSRVSLDNMSGAQPSTNLKSLNALMQIQGIKSSTPVFEDAKKPGADDMVIMNGDQQATPDLTLIYKLRFSKQTGVLAAVKAFQADPNVEYAEPNYIAHLTDTPNDPGFSQQWGMAAVHAEEAWVITKGSPAVTIAILDTGLDLNHPDLAGKIWTNPGEIPGNGIDDDSNGYIDDVSGYDWVNLDNSPQDDNGHGTHVAGIAAANTNNGVGVAGVCWNCKIMPLKVLQSSGRGSYSDIAAAVNYATNKGAKVINMSLGAYADSAVLRDVLAAAYPASVLVAAAGNDGKSIDAPFFPAAYSFVIGVEATDAGGGYASFSNYDPDGPTNSNFSEGYNYDIRAPGDSIYSSMLDDSYASLSGSSMAAPMVAGAAGLLVSKNPSWSKEKIRAQLVQSATGVSDTSTGLLNIYSALTFTPAPLIKQVTGSLTIDDSTGDNDGRLDAGETIDLTMALRNYGVGEATGVTASLSTTDGNVTMINGTSNFGDISAYAKNNNNADPFSFSVSSEALNNHDIVFQLSVTANSGSYTCDLGTFVLTVQRGQEIGGVISSDTTLTPDKYYIVTSPILVSSGVTLTIQPGTTLAFDEDVYLQVDGTLIAMGTSNLPILFTSNQLQKTNGDWGGCNLWNVGICFDDSVNAVVDTSGNYLSGSILQNAIVEYGNGIYILNSAPLINNNIFRYNESLVVHAYRDNSDRNEVLQITNNKFYENYSWFAPSRAHLKVENIPEAIVKNNIIAGAVACIDAQFEKNVIIKSIANFSVTIGGECQFQNNSVYGNLGSYDAGTSSASNFNFDATNNWWGTVDTATIAQRIYDYNDNFNLGRIDYTPFLIAPNPTAPPILHTLAVNPSGIVSAETVTFSLVFSRPMDQNVQPMLTFGVALPYNQHQASGSWSDSTTWVGTYPVTISTGDGINTIRVTSARDLEGTEIPTDERFQFTIQTAGSESLSLNATAGYGRVDLNWFASQLNNTIGYNIYRSLTNTVPTTGTPINTTLVTGTSYLDTTVSNGTKYYYKYTVVDTDLREVAFSNEASATPNDYSAPSTPVVTDDGTCTISTTTLHARWSASDPESGIAGYQYGIGTFPGDVDVINWTSTGTATQVTRTGLNLTDGLDYYFTVKAKNGVGSWSVAGNSNGITIDNTCDLISPTVDSSLRADPDPTSAASVDFTVAFSEAVTGVSAGDFSLTQTGTLSGASVTGVSGAGMTRTVTVNTGTGSGSLRLNIPNSATIIDLAGNPLSGLPYTNGETYTIDKTAPRVVSILRADPNPISKSSVDFTVTFSETVNGVGITDFSLNRTGTISGAIISSVIGTGKTRTVTVNTGTGSGTLRLDIPNSAIITDLAGNPISGLPFTKGQAYTIKKTLTSHSVGVQDGWILESAETSNNGGTQNAAATTLFVGDDKANKQYLSILSFITKGLPDNAVITKITLKIKKQGIGGGGNPVTTFQGFMVDIKNGTFGTSTLQAADFQTVASKTYGPFKPAPVSNWYNIDLPSGMAYINKLTANRGLTQIRLRFKLDDNNNAVANNLRLYSGNASVSVRPQLIIEYYVP